MIEHERRRETEARHDQEGAMLLGEAKSLLHRATVVAKPWTLMKDCDLGREFHRVMVQRGCRTVSLTKVKGHATAQDCQEGKATCDDKFGNDKADSAANSWCIQDTGAMGQASENRCCEGGGLPTVHAKDILVHCEGQTR